jgi:hypothetical protein
MFWSVGSLAGLVFDIVYQSTAAGPPAPAVARPNAYAEYDSFEFRVLRLDPSPCTT